MEFYVDELWKYCILACGYYGAQILYSEGARLEKNMGVLAVIQSSLIIFTFIIDIIVFDLHMSTVTL